MYGKEDSYNSLEPEKFLNQAAPSVRDHYLGLVRAASGSLTGVITNAIQAAFLPHFVVPAVFNLAFLGHYSVQIHIIRKWAKFNSLKLARRSQILASILEGIILKLCANLITLGHGDFALMLDAITIHDGVLHPNQFVYLLNQAQSAYSNSTVVGGLNFVLGGPLNASQNAIGLGGQELTWTEGLSPAQITEMGFANQGNEVLSGVILEKPADKAVEAFSKSSNTTKNFSDKSPLTSSTSFRNINRSVTSLSTRKRFSNASISPGDVPSTVDINSTIPLKNLRNYVRMYKGPRAETLGRRLQKMEQKSPGMVKWVLGGLFGTLFRPVTAVITAASWVPWYLGWSRAR